MNCCAIFSLVLSMSPWLQLQPNSPRKEGIDREKESKIDRIIEPSLQILSIGPGKSKEQLVKFERVKHR